MHPNQQQEQQHKAAAGQSGNTNNSMTSQQQRAAVRGAASVAAAPQQEMSDDGPIANTLTHQSLPRYSSNHPQLKEWAPFSDSSSWTRDDDNESTADDPNHPDPRTTRTRGLSLLESVLQHCPVESEAEAHVMSALEELDPTIKSSLIEQDEAQETSKKQTIFLGEGYDALDAAAVANYTTKTTTADGLPLFSEEGAHRSPTSTAEQLFRLTHELRQQHNEYSTSSTILEVQQQDVPEATTNTEALAQNAANVVNRMKSIKKLEQQQLEDTENKPTTEPSSRVLSNRKLSEKKKSDAHSSNDGNYDDDELNADQTSPTNTDNKIAKPHRNPISQIKVFEEFLAGKRAGVMTYVKVVLLYIIIPATGIAALLFYVFGNPPCGDSGNGNTCRPPIAVSSTNTTNSTAIEIVNFVESASISWWFLFIGVRQVITFSLALATESLITNYIVRTQWIVKLLGPLGTLFVAQSKGWPLVAFFWAAYDFMLTYGRHPFNSHWMFWQDVIDLMNAKNPSGQINQSNFYSTVLILAMVVSFLVTVKRCYVGLWLGRQAYSRYSEDLAEVMKKALLIGDVASLARDLEISKFNISDNGFHVDDSRVITSLREDLSTGEGEASLRGGLLEGIELNSSSRKIRINKLLGEFEEPEVIRSGKDKKSNIWAIIQFRQSLLALDSKYPFSHQFGLATTREECVESSEMVYNRLLLSTPDRNVLSMDTIALLAVRKTGDLDEEKLRVLIRFFRPDRGGTLTLLDFAKSVDSCYKELRLLRANIRNSSRLDGAMETIFNILFYIIIAFIVLAVLGAHPLTLFAAFTTSIVGFSFILGRAFSNIFQGLLVVLVQRPYDIGDRISVSRAYDNTPISGTLGWVVKDITIFSTTVVYASTNEVATFANATIAGYRITNCYRSPQALCGVCVKFPIDISTQKIGLYKAALEKYIEARPREWMSLSYFRNTSFDQGMQYIEYKMAAVHREAWQGASVSQSVADLSRYALELCKTMDMEWNYTSTGLPPLAAANGAGVAS